MTRHLELPDELYLRLWYAAQASGKTVADWLDEHLPPETSESIQTMADVLRPCLGKFQSGGALRASEEAEELFGQDLEQKRRQGHL